MHLPIRTRLTLVSAVLMAAVITSLGVSVYVRLEAEMYAAIDDRLRDRVENLLGDASGGPIVPSPWTPDPGDAFIQVYDADGRMVESSPDVTPWQIMASDDLATLGPGWSKTGRVTTTEETLPARTLAVHLDRGGAILVGQAVEDEEETLGRLRPLLWIGGPLAIVLASIVGWLVAGASLRPVERMRREAEAISGADQDRDLVVPPTNDELGRLGDSLNAMIGRLRRAVVRERRFLGDASHELRTPLANLKAELDLALSRPRSSEELGAALRSAAEETDRLTRLAEDLLALARSDGGRLPVHREPQRVTPLVRETVQSFAGRASKAGVTLVAEGDEGVEASIDATRLRQAISNLVDNALRSTPTGGRVAVTAAVRDGSWYITVTDTGPGFPAEFIDAAFEPFSRADAGRGRAEGGTGLGLSIVAIIAEAHGGTVAARNAPGGGAVVEMRIPV